MDLLYFFDPGIISMPGNFYFCFGALADQGAFPKDHVQYTFMKNLAKIPEFKAAIKYNANLYHKC